MKNNFTKLFRNNIEHETSGLDKEQLEKFKLRCEIRNLKTPVMRSEAFYKVLLGIVAAIITYYAAGLDIRRQKLDLDAARLTDSIAKYTIIIERQRNEINANKKSIAEFIKREGLRRKLKEETLAFCRKFEMHYYLGASRGKIDYDPKTKSYKPSTDSSYNVLAEYKAKFKNDAITLKQRYIAFLGATKVNSSFYKFANFENPKDSTEVTQIRYHLEDLMIML